MLDEQLYQSWLLQLQIWAADGRLFSAGIDALQLKPGQATAQLNRITNRLANGDMRDLPPIEILPSSAMPCAAGAYAMATRTIYINEEWIKTANKFDTIRLLTEEFGHHLDNQLNAEDSPGDEGAIFSEHLLSPYQPVIISGKKINLINERINNNEKICDIEVVNSNLHGVELGPEFADLMIDEYPILSIAASFADSPSIFRGLRELRIKESDRLS